MGETVEFRLLDQDRMKDFCFGDDKRKKLILMFPQDGLQPPPIEEQSESDKMRSKKKRKKGHPYEETVVQDWTQKMLIKEKGMCLEV